MTHHSNRPEYSHEDEDDSPADSYYEYSDDDNSFRPKQKTKFEMAKEFDNERRKIEQLRYIKNLQKRQNEGSTSDIRNLHYQDHAIEKREKSNNNYKHAKVSLPKHYYRTTREQPNNRNVSSTRSFTPPEDYLHDVCNERRKQQGRHFDYFIHILLLFNFSH